MHRAGCRPARALALACGCRGIACTGFEGWRHQRTNLNHHGAGGCDRPRWPPQAGPLPCACGIADAWQAARRASASRLLCHRGVCAGPLKKPSGFWPWACVDVGSSIHRRCQNVHDRPHVAKTIFAPMPAPEACEPWQCARTPCAVGTPASRPASPWASASRNAPARWPAALGAAL